MAMMVSDEVRTMFLVVTGEEWPDANEDKLRALADAWDQAALRLTNELSPQLQQAVAVIRATFVGEAERAFADRMAPFVEGPDNYLAVAGEQFSELAKFLRELALDVEYVKLVSILSLIALIAEIAWAIAMSFWTAGASMAWLAARFAIVRFLLRSLLGRLLMRFAQAAVFGVAFQLVIDVAAQTIQFAMGTRHQWNPKHTANAAAVGAMGAALAPPLAVVGKMVSSVATGGLDKLLGKITTGRDWHQPVSKTVTDIGIESFHETLTEALYKYATEGEFEMNPFSATSGAISGTGGALGGTIGNSLQSDGSGNAPGPRGIDTPARGPDIGTGGSDTAGTGTGNTANDPSGTVRQPGPSGSATTTGQSSTNVPGAGTPPSAAPGATQPVPTANQTPPNTTAPNTAAGNSAVTSPPIITAPTTNPPTTNPPTTAPTTSAPTTSSPTSPPTTSSPNSAPTTSSPTSPPTTSAPTTAPTTNPPVTAAPGVGSPSTNPPASTTPGVSQPAANEPSTDARTAPSTTPPTTGTSNPGTPTTNAPLGEMTNAPSGGVTDAPLGNDSAPESTSTDPLANPAPSVVPATSVPERAPSIGHTETAPPGQVTAIAGELGSQPAAQSSAALGSHEVTDLAPSESQVETAGSSHQPSDLATIGSQPASVTPGAVIGMQGSMPSAAVDSTARPGATPAVAPPVMSRPAPKPGPGEPEPSSVKSLLTNVFKRTPTSQTPSAPTPAAANVPATATANDPAAPKPSSVKRTLTKMFKSKHTLPTPSAPILAAANVPVAASANDPTMNDPWAQLLTPTTDLSSVDTQTLRTRITEAVINGQPAKARILLNRLQGTNRVTELNQHYDSEVQAHPDPNKVEVPKRLHFVWFGPTPTPGAVEGMLEWAGQVGQTGTGWKATLWTDQSAQGWDPAVVKQLSDAGIHIDLTTPQLVNQLSQNVQNRAQQPNPQSLIDIYNTAQSPEENAYNLAADIARYAVLVDTGGVYVDVDIRPGSVSLKDIGDMRMRPDDVPLFAPRLRDKESVRKALGDEAPAVLTPEAIAIAADRRYRAGELNNGFIVAPPNSDFINKFADTIPQKYQSLQKLIALKPGAGQLKAQAPDVSGPNVLVDSESLVPKTSLIGQFTMDVLNLRFRPGYSPRDIPSVGSTDYHALFDPAIKSWWTGLEWITLESETQLDSDDAPGPSTRAAPAVTTSTHDPVRDGGTPAGTPAPPPPEPNSRQGKDIIGDESWRHDPAKTADWFAPKDPVSPRVWQDRRDGAHMRTVDTVVTDVTTDSTPSNIRSYQGLVKYDLRRIETSPGQFVQEYTVKMHLKPSPDVGPAVLERVRDNARNGVDSLLNQGFRLPSGDQFHVNLEFTDDPADAHTTVEVGDTGTDQLHWNPNAGPNVLAHETLHYLGVPDEYRDPSRVFLQRETASGVHVGDGSMMSADLFGRDPGLRPRHLWLAERTANSQVAVPDTRLEAPDPATTPQSRPQAQQDTPSSPAPEPPNPRPMPETLLPPSPRETAALTGVVAPGTRFGDPAAWVGLINGTRGTAGRDVNRVDAALAFHSTYHGVPRVAGATPGAAPPPGGAATAAESYAPELVGRGTAGLAEVIARIIRAGHGADAVVFGYPERGHGHAWNVVNHAGTVSIVDPQAGTMEPATPDALPGLDRVYAIPLDANGTFITGSRTNAPPTPPTPPARADAYAEAEYQRAADIHRMREAAAAGEQIPVRGTTARLVPGLGGLRLIGAVVTAELAADLAAITGRDVVALVIGSDGEEPRRLKFPPKGRPLPVTATEA
jgi:hypothetical protein